MIVKMGSLQKTLYFQFHVYVTGYSLTSSYRRVTGCCLTGFTDTLLDTV